MKDLLLNAFEDFITGNGIWILIGCLAFALVVSIIFLCLNIKKEKKMQENNKQELIAKLAEQYIAEATKEENKEKPAAKKAAAKKPAEAKEPAKKPAAKKAPAKKEPAKEEVKAPAKEEGAEGGDYDISFDAEAKQWVVKRTNLSRAAKRTKTKQEAIDYAKPLADKNGVKLIVHTKDEK